METYKFERLYCSLFGYNFKLISLKKIVYQLTLICVMIIIYKDFPLNLAVQSGEGLFKQLFFAPIQSITSQSCSEFE